MVDARAKLADGLQRAAALRELPEHKREEPEAQAFEVIRTGLMGLRRDEAALDSFSEKEAAEGLGLICKRGSEKRMIRGRAVECLKVALARPEWLRAGQQLPQLRELLADCPDILAKLEAGPPPPLPPPEEELPRLDRSADVEEMLRAGRDVMRRFDWRFPDDPLGTKIDIASEGFQRFFDGMTRLASGRAVREAEELLESFRSEWPGIVRFHVSMYESGRRNAYRSRIKFTLMKLRELAPEFGATVEAEGGLPWPFEPPAEANASSSTAAARTTAAAPPRLGVVWVDFKAEAYQSSTLNGEESIDFVGFHDDEEAEDYTPREKWLLHILERVEDPKRRVAVVVLNRKHLEAIKDIRSFCAEGDHQPPKFVVCTRGQPQELAQWGVDPGLVTQDWVKAAQLVMEELGKPVAIARV